MTNKNLPIKIFEKRKNVDERKTEGGGDPDKIPAWAKITDEEFFAKSGEFLQTIKLASQKLQDRKPERDFIPAVIKVEINEKALAKSHRADIANIFDVNHKRNLVSLTDDRSILVTINSQDDIKEINKNLARPSKHKKGVAAIVEMTPFEPEITVPKENIAEPLRVSLINFHNYQLNAAVATAFVNICKESDITVKKVNYSPELIIFRLSGVTQDAFDYLKEFEALETISQMPKYSITLDELSERDVSEIAIRNPVEGKSYPTVGILDSGITSIPHLEPWVLTDNFSKIPKDRMDTSHGTFVSSIIIYGDDLEGTNYVGGDGCYLFDATIFPDKNKDSIEEFEIVEHIREAIEKNKESIKIWNLSLGTKEESDLTTFSYFGKALDQIQEENNVLICKSAGNCSNDGRFQNESAKDFGRKQGCSIARLPKTNQDRFTNRSNLFQEFLNLQIQ